jgi:CheY-like chemotaxis protein
MGIAADEIENLFEPFVQTTSGQQLREGTGLGIPLTREFVNLMGGELTVTSQVGYGTIFNFEIYPKIARQNQVKQQPSRQVVHLAPGEVPTDDDAYRILIVDDQENERTVLSRFLEAVGFTVRQAANGEEALQQFEEWHPHLICMDMRMPVMDGFEATRLIKAARGGAETSIIALTASTVEEEHQQIFEVGCDDFVQKPFKDMVIFETLAKHLEVTYIYTNLEDDAVKTTAELHKLQPGDLDDLPSELLQALHEDALIGYVRGLEATVEKIADHNPQIAAALKAMITSYDYAGILALLPIEGDGS